MFLLGQIEYESINAGITAGIVVGIMLPMFTCLAVTAYCLYKKFRKDANTSWEFNLPRSRSSSRARINDPALYSQEVSPVESPSRVQSPVSDTSSLASNNKVKRSYDKTYKTNEPLPGKPDYEWEEKDFDVSPEGSDFDKKSPVQSPERYGKPSSPADSPHSSPYSTFNEPVSKPKPKRLYSDPDYVYPEVNIIRTDTLDSGLGHDKHESLRPYTMYEPNYLRENEKMQNSSSQPILNYTDEDYSEVLKPKKKEEEPVASMSSKITAV